METRARSLLKMITYRIVIIAILFVVTLALTGNAGETTTITVVFNVFGALAYYVYERLWDAVVWGHEDKASTRQQ